MKISDIHNNNLIFIDNTEIIKKKKISTKNSIIFIFIGDEDPEKKIFNFYNLFDPNIHKYFVNKSPSISEKFYDELNIGFALRNNLTRMLYGQIGLYPFFHVINKLLINKNKLNVYTEDEKIFNIFSVIKKFTKINLTYEPKNKRATYFKISKLDLLRMYSFDEILFHIKKKFSSKFKKFENLKKNVFVHLSTEANFLSIDRFLNKNWQSKILEVNIKLDEELNSQDFNSLNKILAVNNFIIKKFFHDNFYFNEFTNNEIKVFFKKYIKNYKVISNIFCNLNSNFYFLTKIIRGPILTSLYDFGKKEKKNFFWLSHQHGHGIELSEVHSKTQITKEETLSDLLFVYSPVGKKIKEQNKYIKKNLKIFNVGFNNNKYNFNKLPKYDLIYISNLNQEISSHPLNMSALNNSEKIEFETKLINEVFSKIKLKVLFKEYTGSKTTNIKNNFFRTLISKYNNISYFDEWLNAENIYENSSIILTSLPTSGLGGAICSKKPIIFIDIKNIMPLKENLIGLFKDKFFYFELNENIFEELRELLSNSVEDIQKLWVKKNMSKSDFEKNYINPLPRNRILNSLKKEITKFVV
jgi:hypothetical protein